jgi:hypothetical protein
MNPLKGVLDIVDVYVYEVAKFKFGRRKLGLAALYTS